MGKTSLIFELTDDELRGFCFSLPPLRKSVAKETEVKVDRIPIPTGTVEQGHLRNEQNLLEILSKYRPRKKTNYHKVCLVIPLQQGFIGAYTIPWLAKRDRKSALALLVDKEIAIPKSDVMYDFLVIDEADRQSLKVLVAAARRSLLEKYVLIFAQAGFGLTDINFAYAALGQALEFKGEEDVLYLQEEKEILHMVLFRGPVPESVRSLPLPSSQLESDLHRFLLLQQTKRPRLNLKRIVWSGSSGAEQLARGLSSSDSGITVEKAVLKNTFAIRQENGEESRSFSTGVMGYGWQISANYPKLNLWRQPNSEQTARQTCLRLIFLVLGFFLCLNLMGLFLGQRIRHLQNEVEILSRQGGLIEEQNHNQEALLKAWNVVNSPSVSVGEKLTQVRALSGPEVEIGQVIFKQGSLSVHGRVKDSESIQAMLGTLRALGWKNPTLSSYKLDADNFIQFVLNAEEGRPDSR